jgi:hypothetical protein
MWKFRLNISANRQEIHPREMSVLVSSVCKFMRGKLNCNVIVTAEPQPDSYDELKELIRASVLMYREAGYNMTIAQAIQRVGADCKQETRILAFTLLVASWQAACAFAGVAED